MPPCSRRPRKNPKLFESEEPSCVIGNEPPNLAAPASIGTRCWQIWFAVSLSTSGWPTLAKAKAARSVAEKMLTLGKAGTIHARRLAAARLRHPARTLHKSKAEREAWRRNQDVVRILFEDLAPGFKERNGGYTRIVKLGQRQGDAAQRAILEWVDFSGLTAEPA